MDKEIKIIKISATDKSSEEIAQIIKDIIGEELKNKDVKVDVEEKSIESTEEQDKETYSPDDTDEPDDTDKQASEDNPSDLELIATGIGNILKVALSKENYEKHKIDEKVENLKKIPTTLQPFVVGFFLEEFLFSNMIGLFKFLLEKAPKMVAEEVRRKNLC